MNLPNAILFGSSIGVLPWGSTALRMRAMCSSSSAISLSNSSFRVPHRPESPYASSTLSTIFAAFTPCAVRILAALRGCSRRTVGADAKAVLCRLLGAIGRTCARHKAAASSTEMLRARMRTGVAGCEHGNVLSGILRKSSGSIFLNFESQFFFKT